MAGINPPDFNNWIRQTNSTLRTLGAAVAKARIPRYCTSDARPVPNKLQPGVSLFETDTNRTIYVNATQDGFVDSQGTAL